MRNRSSAVVLVLLAAIFLSLLNSCGDSKASQEDQLQRETQIAQDKAAIEKANYLDGGRAWVTRTPYPEYSGDVEVEGRTVHLGTGGMKIDVAVQASYIENKPGLTFRVSEDKARSVYCDPREKFEKGDIVILRRYLVPGVPVGSLIAKKVEEFLPSRPASRATSR